ncbi:MAG: MFS transporter [Sphingomonas sp.]|nr:MAG: MFS transporter [Sphingomonas sp.]
MPIVLAAAVIDVIGFGVVMPVLPGLVTQLGHMNLTEATRIAGWLLASFAVAQFFAGPVLGNLGDAYGRRVVLIASMVAFSFDYALMAWAPTLGWLFVGRIIAGTAGAIFGPAGAVIADVTPPEKRAGAFGWLGAAFGIGFIIGPALGGLVADYGTRMPFLLAAVLAGTNAIAMILFLPETHKRENRRPFHLRDAHVIGSFKPLFAAGNAAPLLLAWFLWQVGGIVYPAVWSFWGAIRLGWGPKDIGLSLAWVGLGSVIVQAFVTQRFIKAIGERKTAIVALTAGTLNLFALSFVTAGWQVYVLFLGGCLGQMGWPAMQGILSRMVDATRQGALQGGIGSMNSVAQILGPLIAAQSLAFGAAHGFDGLAFVVAGALIGSAALIIAFRLQPLRYVDDASNVETAP